MLISGRDARDQLGDSSPKECFGLDLFRHKRRLRIRIHIWQNIHGDVADRQPSRARVFEAASSCPDSEGIAPARTLLEGQHLLQSATNQLLDYCSTACTV